MRHHINRILMLFALIGMFAASTSSISFADDILVNNVSGDDKLNGKPKSNPEANAGPVRTIARALMLVQPGGRIVVQKTDQPYHESITVQGFKHSGTSYNAFSIVSDGAVLDGTASVPPQAWEVHSGNVFRFSPNLKSFQQLYLDGRPAERIFVTRGDNVPDLEPRQWAMVNGWIYFCAEAGKIASQYDLRYCRHQTGITIYDARNVYIEGLVIQGFQLDAINAHDGVQKTLVRNCRLRGNGRSGLSVGGSSVVTLENSVMGANGSAQVRSEGYCKLAIEDCKLLESKTSGPAFRQDGGRISIDGREVGDALSYIRRNP